MIIAQAQLGPPGHKDEVGQTHEHSWIANEAALAALVDAVASSPLVAVDTEFVREKTYYPQLCLIQIATRDYAACIDCLAPLDLSPLYAQLFQSDRTWVLHSARQDLEVIWQRAERMPPRLIDTQIAAALIGWPPQVGLEGLLARTLQVELGESYARTDWSRRPLPAEALNYAIEDVQLPAARVGRARKTARGTRQAAVAARGVRTSAHGAPRRGRGYGLGPDQRSARAAAGGGRRRAGDRPLARARRAALGSPAPLAARRRQAARARGRAAALARGHRRARIAEIRGAQRRRHPRRDRAP